jgi:imidazolonepropionase-like amidohydrolase
MPKTAIVGGTLLDTSSATPEPTKKTLLIEDGRIVARLEPHESVEANVIDADGLWVLPGLIDAHFHPFLVDIDPSVPRHLHTLAREVSTALKTLETWLESGVTTVRSAGAHENLDVELRELVKRGIVKGPRIFASGYLIAMTSGLRAGNEKIALEVTGPDKAREVARKQIKAGVDSLKLYTSSSVGGGGGRLIGPPGWPHLNEDEIRAVVEEAENAGLPTLAHATSPEAVKNCLRAGVHCIEHASRLDDESIRLLVELDVPIVPTLAIGWSLATFGVERGFGKHIAQSAAAQQEGSVQSMIRAKRAGVRIATGTDADNSRCLLREECRLMVEAGFTPYEALRAATVTASEVVRARHEIGSLETGRHADLLLLDADPLRDIRNLAAVRGVLKGGKLAYWRPSATKPPTVTA